MLFSAATLSSADDPPIEESRLKKKKKSKKVMTLSVVCNLSLICLVTMVAKDDSGYQRVVSFMLQAEEVSLAPVASETEPASISSREVSDTQSAAVYWSSRSFGVRQISTKPQLKILTFSFLLPSQSASEDFTAIPPPTVDAVVSATAEAAAALPLEDESLSTAVAAAAEAAAVDPAEEKAAEAAEVVEVAEAVEAAEVAEAAAVAVPEEVVAPVEEPVAEVAVAEAPVAASDAGMCEME